MTPRKKRILWALAVLLAMAVAVLAADVGCQTWHFSAMCPKCLQRARIREKQLYGLCLWRSIELRRHAGGIMRPDAFGSPRPTASPDTYQAIFDVPCDHEFVKGGFERDPGFIGLIAPDIHAHGGSAVPGFYLPRTEAVATLYERFDKMPNVPLARRTYAVIDALSPVDAPVVLDKRWRQLIEPTASEPEFQLAVAGLRRDDPKRADGLIRLRRLRALTDALGKVQSEQAWSDLIEQFEHETSSHAK